MYADTTGLWGTFLMAAVVLATVCCWAITFKLAVFGDNKKFGKVVEFFTNPVWALGLLLIVPIILGDIAREQLSPLPWAAFQTDYAKHGWWSAISTAITLTMVDLWALWLPAALWLEHHPDVDKRTRRLVRAVNILIGLLLLTPNNPIYWLIEPLA